MRYISLFTGIGGLDRAIDDLGGDPVVQVEREPYCLDVLRLRYPDVPKADNVFAFSGSMGVDLVIGGPPCQPVSHAGRRKGQADERWLWGEALRVVRESMPERVFFENPMGLRTLGLDAVLEGLTELGYGGAWEVVAAADVGAPHLRKRIFIMGVRGRVGWEGPTRPPGNRKVLWPSPNASGERPNEGNVRLLRQRVLDGTLTADEAKGMLNGKSPFEAQGKVPALWPTPEASDGSGGRVSAELGGTRVSGAKRAKNLPSAVAHIPTPTARLGGERGPQAKRYFDPARSNDLDDYVAAFPTPEKLWPTPSAGDNRDRGNPNMPAIQRRLAKGKQMNLSMTVSTERGALNPDWVEWLMGLPLHWTDVNVPGEAFEMLEARTWEVEPANVPRVGLGIPNRSKRLTALGNAVVPAQAIFAWRKLSERLGL